MSTEKILVHIMYAIGTLIVLALCAAFLLHIDFVPFPDAMLPMQLWELAVNWMAMGCIPMLIACAGMYAVSDVRAGAHAKRNTILIFLPGMICLCCLLCLIGMWLYGFLRMYH
ncbi:MAG: hypothetical protein Q4C58_12005 [Eubacteriales bacterium]|nr:hypothetical protein [Eubacteriales bacterium]